MQKTQEIRKKIYDIAFWLLVFVAVLFCFFFRGAIVSGNSMEPTLYDGDIVILSRITGNIDKGDIIVFDGQDRGNLVKRVVGTPGDTIEIRDSVVYRNGEALKEDYINYGYFGSGEMDGPVEVTDGTYFVLGDNRLDSYDSRFSGVGLVSKDDVIGRFLFRFPL